MFTSGAHMYITVLTAQGNIKCKKKEENVDAKYRYIILGNNLKTSKTSSNKIASMMSSRNICVNLPHMVDDIAIYLKKLYLCILNSRFVTFISYEQLKNRI